MDGTCHQSCAIEEQPLIPDFYDGCDAVTSEDSHLKFLE